LKTPKILFIFIASLFYSRGAPCVQLGELSKFVFTNLTCTGPSSSSSSASPSSNSSSSELDYSSTNSISSIAHPKNLNPKSYNLTLTPLVIGDSYYQVTEGHATASCGFKISNDFVFLLNRFGVEKSKLALVLMYMMWYNQIR
jgi:hypothetical protein